MVKYLNRIEKAREFRKRIDANLQATRKLIRVDELSEDELLDMIDLYEGYQVDKLCGSLLLTIVDSQGRLKIGETRWIS